MRAATSVMVFVGLSLLNAHAVNFGKENLKGIRPCFDARSIQADAILGAHQFLLAALEKHLRIKPAGPSGCSTSSNQYYVMVDVQIQMGSHFASEVTIFDRTGTKYKSSVALYVRGSYGRVANMNELLTYVEGDIAEFAEDWRTMNGAGSSGVAMLPSP